MAKSRKNGATNLAPLPHTDYAAQDAQRTVSLSVAVDAASLAAGITAAHAERATLLELKAQGGIYSQRVAELVAESLREWDGQWKALEAKRTETTAPINESKRKVDALFKPGLDELDGLRILAKEMIGAWTVLQAQRQREALAIATEAAQQGAMPELTQALNIANAPAQKFAGVSVKARWVARVTSVELLPMRFQKTIADEEAIAAYVGRFEPHQVPEPVKGLAFELVGGVTQVRK